MGEGEEEEKEEGGKEEGGTLHSRSGPFLPSPFLLLPLVNDARPDHAHDRDLIHRALRRGRR